MTLFETLEPIALVVGWLCIAIVVFIGAAFLMAIVGAIITGLIPGSKVVEGEAPPPIGTRLTAVPSTSAGRPHSSRDESGRPAPSPIGGARW